MIFEAFLGDKWMSWKETDKVSIKKSANIVTIVTEPAEAVGQPLDTNYRPAHDRLKTVFNLSVIPAYTIG